MRRAVVIAWALAALLGATLAGCGGGAAGGERTTAGFPTPDRDAALASSILLTGPDMPADWLHAPRKANDDQATLAAVCHRDTQPRMTARASSDDFLFDGQSPSLSETVSVFQDDAAAHASIAAVMTEAYVGCLMNAIGGGQLRTPGVVYSNPSSESIPLDVTAGQLGDEALAFRAHALESLADGSTPLAQFTFVFGRKGRVVYELLVRGSGSPLAADEASDFAATAASKIRQ